MVEQKICYICKKPILPGQAWTYVDNKVAHWTCLELAQTEAFRTQLVRMAKRAVMKEAEKVAREEIRKEREKGEISKYICPICKKPVYPEKQPHVYLNGQYYHLSCYTKWMMR
jgi:hypothetical protein